MNLPDILLIGSQIATAIGTLVLAGVTYKTIKQSSEQLKLLREQTRRLRHDKPALLKVIRWKAEKDTIKVDLENIGEQRIFQIGLETQFSLAMPYFEKKNKQNFISFGFDPSRLIDNFENSSREVKGNGFINWGKDKKMIILSPKEIIYLEFIPKFNLYYHEEGKFVLGTAGRSLPLKDLIEVMKKNNKRFFGIECSIIFKNYLEEVQAPIELFNFVFDIEKDKTFEDCIKKAFKAQYHALSSNELETILDGMDSQMYRGIKNPGKELGDYGK